MIPLGVLAQRQAASGVNLTYLGNYLDDVAGTEFTFTDVGFGPASTGRHIILVYVQRGSVSVAAPSSITIGGISSSFDATIYSGSSHSITLARAAVPTGASGDVSVTTTSVTRAGFAIYATDAPVVVVDTATATSNAQPLTVDAAAGGFVVAGSYGYRSTAQDCSWSVLTEDVQFYTELAGLILSSAHATTTSAAPVSPTPTWDASMNDVASLAVAYQGA